MQEGRRGRRVIFSGRAAGMLGRREHKAGSKKAAAGTGGRRAGKAGSRAQAGQDAGRKAGAATGTGGTGRKADTPDGRPDPAAPRRPAHPAERPAEDRPAPDNVRTWPGRIIIFPLTILTGRAIFLSAGQA